jgi:hypothetical protein
MKASAMLGTDWEGDSLQVLWADTERVFCRLSRDNSGAERHAFITAIHGSYHRTLQSINRLTHEYELKECLEHCLGPATGGAGPRTRANDAGGRIFGR